MKRATNIILILAAAWITAGAQNSGLTIPVSQLQRVAAEKNRVLANERLDMSQAYAVATDLELPEPLPSRSQAAKKPKKEYKTPPVRRMSGNECYRQGWDEMQKEKPSRERAKGLFITAARQGCIEAMNELGFLYWTDPVPDEAMALEWFSKAAEAGDPSGLYNTAYCYLNGVGTYQNEKDPELAVTLLRSAVKKGNTDAVTLLAECLMKGVGTEKDLFEAESILRDAIDNEPNNGDLVFTLGLVLMENDSAKKRDEGYRMIKEAADEYNNEQAAEWLKNVSKYDPNN